jgi:hypothetical protein
VHDWLDHLMHEARIVELRHADDGRWRSGLFDDIGALRRAAAELQLRHSLFTTLNRPHATVKATNAMGTRALSDADMVMHTRLVFDFDPVRPKGMSSTDYEMADAIRQRNRLMATLSGMGWPAPVVACSGNGGHLVYRLRLLVADDVAEMLTTIYRGLRRDFSTEAVEFDPTVRNPARIWRLYGTINRKGIPTPNRPHRTAVAVIPGRWEAVSPRLIEALADSYARTLRAHPVAGSGGQLPVVGEGDYRSLDVVGWFAGHGAYRRHLGHGKHAVMCPWAHEHSIEAGPLDTSTVVWEASGNWPSFYCSHAHCEGRSIRDVLALWGDADAYCAWSWPATAKVTL